MKRIKRNDMAMVIAGNDAGKTGKVLRLIHKDKKIVVAGVTAVADQYAGQIPADRHRHLRAAVLAVGDDKLVD